jgi:hypothetical protein
MTATLPGALARIERSEIRERACERGNAAPGFRVRAQPGLRPLAGEGEVGAARLRRLRPEGDLVALLSVAGGSSYMRSIRTAGKMTTAAETFGGGVSHDLRRTRGNIMTAPITPPGRFTQSWCNFIMARTP